MHSPRGQRAESTGDSTLQVVNITPPEEELWPVSQIHCTRFIDEEDAAWLEPASDDEWGPEAEEEARETDVETAISAFVSVVNAPPGLDVADVSSLFEGAATVAGCARVRLPVRHAIGHEHSFEVEVRKDEEMPAMEEADFEQLVVRHWQFEVTECHPESHMWLRLHRRRPPAARSVITALAGCHVGSFLDHGSFIPRDGLRERLQLTIDVGMRTGAIRVPDRSSRPDKPERYLSIEFDMKQLTNFVVMDVTGQATVLFLMFCYPPRLFRVRAGGTSEDDLQENKKRLTRIRPISRDIFGQCLTYRLEVVCRDSNPIANLWKVVDALAVLGKEIYFGDVVEVPYRCQLPTPSAGVPLLSKVHGTNHEVNMAWMCLSSSSGFVPDRFGSAFFNRLDGLKPELAIAGLYAMASLVPRNLFGDPEQLLGEALRGRSDLCSRGFCHIPEVEDSKTHCRVPRLVITPTRLVFYEPDIMQTNRVLRNFPKDRFLRVAIRDENGAKISPIYGKIGKIMDRICDIMLEGVDVKGEYYRFLASSNSQIKDHACYFVRDNGVDRPGAIRSWIGNLAGIKNVATYVSRLGLGFSTSTETAPIEVDDFTLIPDVERNGYCFSDGVGKMSPQLAEKIKSYLKHEHTPCAVQIRFGGSKGVIAVDPTVPTEGLNLFIRDSMNKYDSSHRVIEVLSSVAMPQKLHLNQQVIMLLCNLEVPEEAFENLLKEHLNEMSEMFVDESAARSKLQGCTTGIHWKDIASANFPITSEPYFRSLLMTLYRVEVKNLREKSRIPIDTSKARMLMGVMDETGSLRYGQVFIQISENFYDPGGSKLVLEQPVAVSKSPCLHPGDLKTLHAVDIPDLHHLSDCIVFPSTGHRPHPNELSGSDLDGDLYHVIWDDELMPRAPNKEPMEYPKHEKLETEGEITEYQMIGFMREIIEKDCLGQISNAHKALADQQGLECEGCKTLAQLHSQAVDASKTGKWVKVPADIREDLKKYPDFMMKEDKESYASEKVLGRMFRECTMYMNACSIDTVASGCSVPWKEPSFQVDGYEQFLEPARKLRAEYNTKLETLMRMYGIKTEAELMTGQIETVHMKLGREKSDVCELIARVRDQLVQSFRKRFVQDPMLGEGKDVRRENVLKKASAWYCVTYDTEQDPETYVVGNTRVRFLSFPWIVSDALIHLYTRNRHGTQQQNNVHTVIHKSIMGLFADSESYLASLRNRIAVQEAVARFLEEKRVFLSGSSLALLFDVQTMDVDLLLWATAVEPCHNRREFLERVTLRLRAIPSVRQAQILRGAVHCVRFALKGVTDDGGHPVWKTMVSARLAVDYYESETEMVRTAVLVKYIERNPWLLPVLRVLVMWARAAGLVGYDVGCLLDPIRVCLLFVHFCVVREEVEDVDFDYVYKNYTGDGYRLVGNVGYWYWIINQIAHSENRASGKLLLEFFRRPRKVINEPLRTAIGGCLRRRSFADAIGREARQLLEDEMRKAFHRLSTHMDAIALMHKNDTKMVFFMDLSVADTMLGHEEHFARRIQRRTNTSIQIHPRLRDKHNPGLFIWASGTLTAMRATETTVQDIAARSRAFKLMKEKYKGTATFLAPGSTLCIIERCTSGTDRLRLEDYDGHRHPDHDIKSLYTMRLSKFDRTYRGRPAQSFGCEFDEFQGHCLGQLRAIQMYHHSKPVWRDLCCMEVRFGQCYLVSPKRAFVEDPDGVPVESLLKDVLDRQPREVDPESWDGHWKRNGRTPIVAEGEGVERDLPLPFHSHLHSAFSISRATIQEELRNNGFGKIDHVLEYELTVYKNGHWVVAVYDHNLELLTVKMPKLVWSSIVVKRSWMQGRECDVQFEIASQPDRWDKAFAGFLFRENGKVMVGRLAQHVFERIKQLKTCERWGYSCTDFGTSDALRDVKIYVTRCKVESWPIGRDSQSNKRNLGRMRFSQVDEFWEVCIVPSLRSLLTQSPDLNQCSAILVDLWRLAWKWSSMLMGVKPS